ncbi:MAG: FG-GAP-like repeat-containing protein [Candidatus Glassbacteria bacterium]
MRFLIILIFLIPAKSFPYAPILKIDPSQNPTGIMYTEHDANEVRLGLMSSGQIGIDNFAGNGAGFWPKDTENNYIFGTGLWIAGLADVDGDGLEDTLGIQAYNPIDGGTEFAPGRATDDPDDPMSRLFVSTNATDLTQWPDEFRNEYGDPIVYSLQDIVGIYNDINGTFKYGRHKGAIEVYQRSMAFMTGRTSQVIIFIWDITNISELMPHGPYTIEDTYIGLDSDIDIGTVFADDRTSFFRYQLTEKGDSIPIMMAFGWDNDFDESWGNFEGIPGFVGFKFLLSPGNDMDGIDNDGDGLVDESPYNGIDDDGDGEVDEWDEVDELGLVNYTFSCGPSACESRPHPMSDTELYRMMKCDPPDECLETIEDTDIAFLMSSGPFDWPPGRTMRVAIAYVFALPVGEPDHIEVYGDPPRPDPNDPVFADFLAVALNAQSFFGAGFPDTVTGFYIYDTTDLGVTNLILDPTVISTSVVSSEGVADLKLFYSYDGGTTFSSDDMEYIDAYTYAGLVPGPGEWWSDVQYFVQAVDSTFLVIRDPPNAPSNPYEYTIVYTPDFLPRSTAAGIGTPNPASVAWLDYDSDGDLDFYLTQKSSQHVENTFFRNDGERTFTDVTGETGTGFLSYPHASTGDYDNDGYEDMVIASSENSPLLLLRNAGDGTFENVSPKVGLEDPVITQDLSWSDVDSDGFLDIIALSGRCFLYMNEGGGEFIEDTESHGLPTADFQAYDLLCFDADNDGDDDIVFAGSGNRYYENEAGVFTDKTEYAGLVFSSSFTEPLDVNHDTHLDLLFYGSADGFKLLTNDGEAHFTDDSETYGVTDLSRASHFTAGDMNANGLPDLVLSTWEVNYLILGPEGKYFDATSFFDGGYYSNTVSNADADGDGMLDIFKKGLWLSAGFPGGYVNNWLEVDLVGTVSNRSAVGAVATLYPGERTITDFVSASVSKPKRLYFGMEQETPDSLIIRWPSGIVQVERDLPVNAIITIEEDSTLVAVGGDVPSRKIPTTYALYQNYPNPFNPQTTIGFDLPDAGEKIAVRLSIYDVRGRLVRKLVDGELSPGQHRVIWDGRDDAGVSLGSGVYLYMIKTGDFTESRKLVLLK